MTPADRLRLAASIYAVTADGRVFNAIRKNGKFRKLDLSESYPRFGHKFEDGVRQVMVHRLVAFKKYGEALFQPGIEVRHKDGNPGNFEESNIIIGTHSENMMDRSPERRVEVAKNAARRRRKFTDDQITEIRAKRIAGATLPQLAIEYRTYKSTLSYIVRGLTYAPTTLPSEALAR